MTVKRWALGTEGTTASYTGSGDPDDKWYMHLNSQPPPTDVWIKEIGVWCGAENPLEIRLALYEGESLKYKSPIQTVHATGWAFASSPSIRIAQSRGIRWGVFRHGGFHANYELITRWKDVGNSARQIYDFRAAPKPTDPPNPHNNNHLSIWGSVHQAAYYDYVENVAPLSGSWAAGSPSGVIGTVTPTFAGTTPHPASEEGLDYTSEVHLQVWRPDTGAMAYDSLFATTQTEKNNDNFSRAPVTLTQGVTYRAKYRHRDSWGVYSGWSTEIQFTTASIPNTPDIATPSGKINQVSGETYSFPYSHPNGIDAVMLHWQIWNAQGTTKLFDTGQYSIANVVSGSTISTPSSTIHATNLAWGTAYKVRVGVKDANGNWSPWSPFENFHTNSQPGPPTNLAPADDLVSLERTFTARASDPNGDTIQSIQAQLVNVDTNAVVAGYPKEMTVAPSTGEGSLTAPETDFSANTNYKWRARASDLLGGGYGPWSDYAFFRYASVPAVSIRGPKEPRTNLIPQPSFEYESVTAWWSETARTATDYIDRVADGNAAYGVTSLRAVTSATGDNKYRTPLLSVDATKPYLASMEMRKESGVSSSLFGVLCYDSAGLYLGVVTPNSIAEANNLDAPSTWTRYGGIVWPAGSANAPSFFTGTTQIQLEWRPSLNSECVVRGDAFHWEQLPVFGAVAWSEVQNWFGFQDVDSTENIDDGKPSNYWQGDIGDSPQTILPALVAPSTTMRISYSSPSGAAKKDDRVVIQQWRGDRWFQILDTGYRASSSIAVPIPSGYFKNGERYRVQVIVRDTGDVVGTSAWVRLDVRYVGPPELNIISSEVDAVRGELKMQFNPSNLPAEEYAGIEVAREAADGSEPLEIFQIIRDPNQTEAIYDRPVSGKVYYLRVRQVKVVGSDQVEGRWSTAILTVSYPNWFLKTTDENQPRILPFTVYAQDGYSVEDSGEFNSYRPWKSSRKVHMGQSSNDGISNLVVRVWEDEEEDAKAEKLKILEYIRVHKPTLVLLGQRPAERRFVQPLRVLRSSDPLPGFVSATIEIEDTFYSENALERD